jgi:hypothetical protein
LTEAIYRSIAQTHSQRDRLFKRPASGTLTGDTQSVIEVLTPPYLRVLGDIKPEQLPQNQYFKGSAAKNLGVKGYI